MADRREASGDLNSAHAITVDGVIVVASARAMEAMGMHTFLARVLLVEREWQADRTTVVLVREPVGV